METTSSTTTIPPPSSPPSSSSSSSSPSPTDANAKLHSDVYSTSSFTGPRGLKVFYRRWASPNPSAVLWICHGLGEHGGRYQPVVEHFVPRGFSIYVMDLIGHGHSEGPRCNVESFQDYMSMCSQFHQIIKTENVSKRPVHLFGHSMGGLVAVSYILSAPAIQPDFASCSLSCPALKLPTSIGPATIFFGKVASVILPSVGVAPIDTKNISRDPAIVKDYETDPLNFHGSIPARLGASILSQMELVGKQFGTITLPLFIMQGTADITVNAAGAKECFDQAKSTMKELKQLEGLYHELVSDPDKAKVFEAWQSFMDRLPNT